MGILDMKKEYLSDDEIRDYNASLKRIHQVEEEIESKKIIIDNLRKGIIEVNLEMSRRQLDYMKNSTKK